jgi:hypothetical protein
MVKRRGGNHNENLTLEHKSLERKGQMRFNWTVLYIIGKMFSRDIRYCPLTLKKNLI